MTMMLSASLPSSTMQSDEKDIPKAPPQALRSRYIAVSWSYVYWCIGMLIWAALCVSYFIRTSQFIEMGIGIFLGGILIAMIAGPAFLFGGETWYKRLGWMLVLLCMFSLMWIYPMIAAAWGINKRIREGRYAKFPRITDNDWWHLVLCLLTIVLAIWTFLLTKRVVAMTRALARGEFGEMDIRIREQ
jgi:hypothetical protein